MSEKKYLDTTGLEHFWSKLKETFANKTETFLYYTVATDFPPAETITFESLYNSLIERFGTSNVILKSTGYFSSTGFLTILYKGGYYDVSFIDLIYHRIYNSEGLYLPGTTKISVIFEDAKDIITEDDLPPGIINITGGLTTEIHQVIQKFPSTLLLDGEGYIYTPTYEGSTAPTYYSCCAADENKSYWLIIDWDTLEISDKGNFMMATQIEDLTTL